jgi:hypothetical protein
VCFQGASDEGKEDNTDKEEDPSDWKYERGSEYDDDSQ